MRKIRTDNCYRLVVNAEDGRPPRSIEFHARGAESALMLAERHFGAGRAELFENGRPLGSVQNTRAGFWVVGPPGAPLGDYVLAPENNQIGKKRLTA